MKSRKILAHLEKIANILDENFMSNEADQITKIMLKIANSNEEAIILNDIYSSEDKVTNQIQERDLKTHKILLEFQINEDSETITKEFNTKITNADLIKRASIQFVIDSNNLISGDAFTINIKAINPRSNNKIWEVEYFIEIEDDDKISFDASPLIPKQNYEIEDITEHSGSDFISDIVKRSIQQSKNIEDPTIQSARQMMKDMPGDLYEKAYNTALEELRSHMMFESGEVDSDLIDRKAKEIAQRFINSNNKTAEFLNELIDEVIIMELD